MDDLKQAAGFGVGTLAALTTIKGGGLGPYLMNRQRLMSDPGFRATLAGSPFMSGVFGVTGAQGPAPAPPTFPAAAGGAVAQPSDFVGPPMPGQQVAPPGQAAPGQLPDPTALNVPGYMPGTPRQWMPNLPPYDPEEALKQQALATQAVAIRAPDPLVSGIAKTQLGIMPTDAETRAVLGRAADIQHAAGAGSTVGVKLPGMQVQIGSPYNFASVSSEEYPTPQLAEAAAAARNASIPPGNPRWTVVPSGRGSFLLAPPATGAQTLPAAPPAPEFRTSAGGPTAQTPTTGGPPATVATRTNNPGNIKDGPFARAQPGYVGAGPTATDGGQFAVFDSPASGFAAQGNLLRGPAYRDLSVHDAFNKWSNGGYGGELVAPLGIDPRRTVSSLTPEELRAVTLQQAQREGYQFGGAAAPAAPPPTQVARATPPAPAQPPAPEQPAAPPPAAAPPPPRPVARPAPPPPATAAPSWDPNATVPHVIVPAPEARVGFPPPAFGGETPATVPITPPTTVPPGAAVAAAAAPPPPMPPAAVAVDPTTGLPLAGRTVESQSGSQTYTAPSLGDVDTQLRLNKAGITDPKLATGPQIANYFAQERAWGIQQKLDAADVERLRRSMSEGDAEGLRQLMDLRNQVNRFEEKYNTPEARAQFIGPGTWWLQGLQRDIRWQGARQITDFRAALAPFSFDTLGAKDSPLKGDLAGLATSAPSGSDSSDQFESNLQSFRDRLDDKIIQRLAFRGVPESEITPERVNGVLEAAQADRFARRLQAVEPPAAAPPPGAPPPAPTAPPPGSAYAGPPPPPATTPVWQPTWIR